MNIINLSDFESDWCWLKDEFKEHDQEWIHFSSQSVHLPNNLPIKEIIKKLIPKHESVKRASAAWNAVSLARKSPSILISHGPRTTFYCANLAEKRSPDTPHLAYSFNFTDLPQGEQHKLMAKAFEQPTKFVTYSTDERKLYADYFDMPIEKIDMQYWSVHPPKVDFSELPVESGDYICALGSQARDYKTLLLAMKKLPHIKLVVVATEENMAGLEIPLNVIVYSNIPYPKAMNILMHSQFMILPLRDSAVPCGHGSIVSAMFYKKAIIITDSSGVYDYVKDGETGLFYEALNDEDLSQKISQMWEDKKKLIELSDKSYQFAQTHCTEKTAINYFTNFINEVS